MSTTKNITLKTRFPEGTGTVTTATFEGMFRGVLSPYTAWVRPKILHKGNGIAVSTGSGDNASVVVNLNMSAEEMNKLAQKALGGPVALTFDGDEPTGALSAVTFR